jgi:hypothetical protein
LFEQHPAQEELQQTLRLRSPRLLRVYSLTLPSSFLLITPCVRIMCAAPLYPSLDRIYSIQQQLSLTPSFSFDRFIYQISQCCCAVLCCPPMVLANVRPAGQSWERPCNNQEHNSYFA